MENETFAEYLHKNHPILLGIISTILIMLAVVFIMFAYAYIVSLFLWITDSMFIANLLTISIFIIFPIGIALHRAYAKYKIKMVAKDVSGKTIR